MTSSPHSCNWSFFLMLRSNFWAHDEKKYTRIVLGDPLCRLSLSEIWTTLVDPLCVFGDNLFCRTNSLTCSIPCTAMIAEIVPPMHRLALKRSPSLMFWMVAFWGGMLGNSGRKPGPPETVVDTFNMLGESWEERTREGLWLFLLFGRCFWVGVQQVLVRDVRERFLVLCSTLLTQVYSGYYSTL